jgi:hypothetical protein
MPGTEGAGAGAGSGAGATETMVEAVAESSPVERVAANKFEVKITEKVSTKALNEVMLLKTVLLNSMNSSKFVIFGLQAIVRDYGLHCRKGQMTKGPTASNIAQYSLQGWHKRGGDKFEPKITDLQDCLPQNCACSSGG